MLKTRIIPTLLFKDEGLVKGVGFDSWRRVGTALPAIRVYNRRQVDELIILDISASEAGRGPDLAEVSSFSSGCFVPLTVGGGISSLNDITNLLRAGADKVSVNSVCYRNPELIAEAADRFGSQCIVVSIDARKGENGSYECYSLAGKKAEGISPVAWAQKVESLGAGELLITSIEKDGLMQGYDLELIRQITGAVKIPVIASGGAANYEDFRLAIQEAGAQAVSAASMFHFTEQTPLQAKKYLADNGIAVRRTVFSVQP